MGSKQEFIDQLAEMRWSSLGSALFLRTRELEFTLELATEVFTKQDLEVYTWSRTNGLVAPNGNVVPVSKEFASGLHAVQQLNKRCVVLFENMTTVLQVATQGGDAIALDALRDLFATTFRAPISSRPNVVFIGSDATVPAEISEYFQTLDMPLPDYDELSQIWTEVATAHTRTELDEDIKRAIINAALGLTRVEARVAFNRTNFDEETTREDANIVASMKTAKYKDRALEHYDSVLSLDDVGGLENLKKWLAARAGLWQADPKETHIPHPKGVLLTGLPGTGKSLSAKAIAATFGFTLLRFDIGAVFGKYYGESEAGMRDALHAAEASAPCVLWIDEIEKGLGNGTDEGSQTRDTVLGTLLTWMQEHTKDVFIVATANNIQKLRPELLRKGRFDEIFFVDLPTAVERAAIFKVHLKKKDLALDADMPALVAAAEGFVGAEIEQAINAAMIDAFNAKRKTTAADILTALKATTPLSVIQHDSMLATRQWAQENNAVYASEEKPEPVPEG